MIFGTVVEAILRINQGHQSTRYIRDIAEMVLHALGVDSAERSEEHTSELQSLMRITYAVFCLNKKINTLVNIPQFTNHTLYNQYTIHDCHIKPIFIHNR